MAGTWTTERFPHFEPAIRKLTEQHKGLKDEPLHLAIAYEPAPGRNQQDIYLFEVVGGGLDELVNPDRELFETTFYPTANFLNGTDEKLHLILTSPRELTVALKEKWPSLSELINALHGDEYRLLHADDIGNRLVSQLQNADPAAAARSNG